MSETQFALAMYAFLASIALVVFGSIVIVAIVLGVPLAIRMNRRGADALVVGETNSQGSEASTLARGKGRPKKNKPGKKDSPKNTRRKPTYAE